MVADKETKQPLRFPYPRVTYQTVTRAAREPATKFWARVAAACERLKDEKAQEFFLPHLETVRTVIVEDEYICKDHRNLHRHFYAKKFLRQDSYTSRLHFFSRAYASVAELILEEKPSDDYLGFSVIRNLGVYGIGRTVFTPKALSIDRRHFYSLTTEFRVHLAGRHLFVHGYPFMGQDAESTVCAHVVLWGICRYLSERYCYYQELYPFDIVALAEPRRGRTSPYGRLTFEDCSRVFSSFGCHPAAHALREPGDRGKVAPMTPEAFRLLYCYIESGIPVAATIGTHAVGIIGHTCDPKTPRKRRYWHRRFIDSSEFVDGLIVMDDNFFPYRVLARDSRSRHQEYGRILGKSMRADRPLTVSDIRSIICPLPEKIFLTVPKARERFTEMLDFWEQDANVRRFFRRNDLVARMFITTGNAVHQAITTKLLAAKSASDLPCDAERILFHTLLPHFVWVMEISTIGQFRRQQTCGRLILDATSNSMEQSLIIGYLGTSMMISQQEPKARLALVPMTCPVGTVASLSHDFAH